MKKIFYTLCFVTLGFVLTSCGDDKSTIIPGEISNITSKPGPGYISLSWTAPKDGNVLYTQVEYFDHLTQKNAIRLSSCDTINIPNTRKKFGEYNFKLRTFSITGNSSNVQEITAVSDKAPATIVKWLETEPMNLTIANLSSNACADYDGQGFAGLLDNDDNTYFHSFWAENSTDGNDHYLQVNLDKPIRCWGFFYGNRKGTNRNKPSKIVISGSNDGNGWTELFTLAGEKDGLPVSLKAWGSYKTTIPFFTDVAYKHIRFTVKATNTGDKCEGHPFFSMCSFRFYEGKFTVDDPEAN